MDKEYTLSTQEVLRQLDATETGLTGAEAAKRAETYGPNKLKEAPKPSWIQRFWAQLKDPMLIILLVVGGISVCRHFRQGLQVQPVEKASYFLTPDKPDIRAISYYLNEDVVPAQRAYLTAVLATRCVDAEETQKQVKQIELRLAEVQQQLLETIETLMDTEAHVLTADDLPKSIPALYRARIENSLRAGLPEQVAETVWSVVDEWETAFKVSGEAALNTLVPVHPYAIAGGMHASAKSDAWLEKTAEQRLGDLYVAKLLRKVLEEWNSMLFWAGYVRYTDPDEEHERLMMQARDHRCLLAPLLVNAALQDAFCVLFRDAYPEAGQVYKLPDDARFEVLPCLAERVEQDVAFARLQYALLVQDFNFDRESEYQSKEEVRRFLEHKLQQFRKNMERTYSLQLEYVSVALSLYAVGDDNFTEEQMLCYYETYLQKIQTVFANDVRILRHYAEWIPEEKKGNLDSLPAPSMQPVALPSFMICGTPGEGDAIYLYRRSGDAVRADVRRAYADAFKDGYELLLGGCCSRERLSKELQFLYMKSRLDDAEYSWLQYVRSIYELMEPPLRSDWGSGTGIIISEQMSRVYENHSRFYSEVLNISPAGYSRPGDEPEEMPE